MDGIIVLELLIIGWQGNFEVGVGIGGVVIERVRKKGILYFYSEEEEIEEEEEEEF